MFHSISTQKVYDNIYELRLKIVLEKFVTIIHEYIFFIKNTQSQRWEVLGLKLRSDLLSITLLILGTLHINNQRMDWNAFYIIMWQWHSDINKLGEC